MMLPGKCARCGAPVELHAGENPVYWPHLDERVPFWWEDRGTGEQHRCAP